MSREHGPLTNAQLLGLAWRIIGGWTEMRRSWHFWVAVFIWAVSSPGWTTPEWWKDVISVLPNLLGFTLGGFAIFLGFGSDAFKEMISSEDEERAEYLSVSAAFLSFVGVQVAALLWALACSATWQPMPSWLLPAAPVFAYGKYLFWGAGYFLFVYGVVLTAVVALRVFRLSRWYNSFLVFEAQRGDGEATDGDKAANDSGAGSKAQP
jgi:hypothetical protein